LALIDCILDPEVIPYSYSIHLVVVLLLFWRPSSKSPRLSCFKSDRGAVWHDRSAGDSDFW